MRRVSRLIKHVFAAGGSANAYAYVYQNPLTEYDLAGTFSGYNGTYCEPGHGIRECWDDLNEYRTQELFWDYALVLFGMAGLTIIGAALGFVPGLIVGLLGAGVGLMLAYLEKVDNQGGNVGIVFDEVQVQTVCWWFGMHYGSWHTIFEHVYSQKRYE